MRKTEQIKMLKLADEYASKQGTMEYESSYEDFIEGYKAALTIPVASRSKCVNLVIDSTNGDYILTDRELKEYEDNELFMDGDKVYKAELVKEY